MNKILIVDDDSSINNMLKETLEKNGYTCMQAFSGTEAMLLLNQENYDLMLLDLMLPGISGEEVLKRTREEKKIPVIVMLVTALAGAFGSRMAFGYVYIDEFADLFSYLGSQYLLHFALAMIILCVTMVLRSSAISMTIAVCLCMNISSLLYALVDKLVAKCGVEDFHLSEYVVTGNISLLPAAWDSKMYIRAIVVAICFAAVSVAIGSITVKKRDIA